MLPIPNAQKARFKEVQEAWEALSDPKERAWYDDHRESILRGEAPGQGGGEGGGGGRGDEPNLWPYFHAGAFKGYGDGPQVGGAWVGRRVRRMCTPRTPEGYGLCALRL